MRSPKSRPNWMSVKWTLPPGSTAATCGPSLRTTRVSPGMSSGGSLRGTERSTSAYSPGIRVPLAFGTWTSTSRVRVAGSSALAVRATVPLNLAAGHVGDGEDGGLADADGFGIRLGNVQVSAEAVRLGDAEEKRVAFGHQHPGIHVAQRDHSGERRAHGLIIQKLFQAGQVRLGGAERCCARRPRLFRAPARWIAGPGIASGRNRYPGATPRLAGTGWPIARP